MECPLLTPHGASDSELPLLSIHFSSPELPHSHSLKQCDSLDFIELSSEIDSDLTLTSSTAPTQLAASDDIFPSSPSLDIPFDPPFPTSSPITVTTPRKGGLHSYFPTLHRGALGKRSESESSPLLPSPSKRARVQPPSSPQLLSLSDVSKDAPQPLNKLLGKSAANKLELNKAVEAGTFKRDKRKWEKFKSKILEIDPHSEVDDVNPKRARDVLHVKCGKVLRMATVYDVSLFKRHIQLCKSHTAQAGMHTLDHGLNFVFLQQDVSSSFAGTTGSSARNKSTSTWPCPGLSGESDPHIANYLLRTTVPSAGGTSIENIAHDMFSQPYKDLTDAEKHAVRIGQMHTHRWSLEHQQRRIFAIGVKPCLRKVPHNAGSPQPCDACSALLKDRAFRTAIYRTVPNDENRKFTPHLYQAAEIAKISAKHSGLGAIFDKVGLLNMDATLLLISKLLNLQDTPNNKLLYRFARSVASGTLKDKPMFMDFTSAMLTLAERQECGRGLQGMHYPPAFDEWCHELLCLSPGAYRVFRSHFGGRTERSFHQIRSKSPIFCQGITPDVYERARQYCIDYNYPLEAPLAIGVDDTALLKAIRPFLDPTMQKWFAIGLVGDTLEVPQTNAEDFHQQMESAGRVKADKLRLWTLQIPLPHVPPAILAVAAISSRTSASTLAQMDEDLLRILMKREEPVSIISIGSDGAVSERKARQELMSNLIKSGEGETIECHIKHPDGRSSPIVVPLFRAFGKTMAIVQDSKHCRKTMRNNLFSGARALILARYVTFYQQVRDIVDDTEHSPLRRRDVERLDHQDDHAAERLFSSATLDYTINHLGKSNLGLSIYLFIFGDLIDAYQSRKISHAERVIMVLRAKFFKDLWKSFLHEGRYPAQHYFISQDADKIIDILIHGLLGLIFIHRDSLPLDGNLKSFPLMPWTHGSESNEHVFGIMRSLITDFTMLDVIRMIPKLTVRLQAACRTRHQHVGDTASGYSHTYFHDEDAPSSLFSQFPSDETIESLAKVSYEEACYLWSLLGYEPSESLSLGGTQLVGLGDSTPLADSLDDSEEDVEDDAATSDRRELLDAIKATSKTTDSAHNISRADHGRLHEYTFAAAALNLQDFSNMYVHIFPSDSESVIIIFFSVKHYQTQIQHYSET